MHNMTDVSVLSVCVCVYQRVKGVCPYAYVCVLVVKIVRYHRKDISESLQRKGEGRMGEG